MADQKAHWESIYKSNATAELSWFQAHPSTSLALIERTGIDPSDSIIDIGGGDSTLVDHLLDAGYGDLTVLDISAVALQRARLRLGGLAKQVRWLESDVTAVALPRHTFALWHDRAVFHFLTDAGDRQNYVHAALRALKPNGHIIVATFGPTGPETCSGLDTVRYDPNELHHEFGKGFRLVESIAQDHRTPFGASQMFVYCYCRRT